MGIRFAAEAQMRELGDRPAYVLAGEGWHAGVIGIVASRLVESSGRPVVMIAIEGERGRGSGRSMDAVDLLASLTACSEHLVRFGGHSAAAGLEIERDRLPAFAAALEAHVQGTLDGADLVPVERVDAVVQGPDLGMDLAEELARLAPFGRGNPGVSLMVDEATFADPRPMGEGKHLRFTVQSGGVRARAVAFGGGSGLPVAGGRARTGHLHAGGQRMERRERAAPGSQARLRLRPRPFRSRRPEPGRGGRGPRGAGPVRPAVNSPSVRVCKALTFAHGDS